MVGNTAHNLDQNSKPDRIITMPLYDYVCSNCQYEIGDMYQSIKAKPLVKCDKCNKMTLERVIYGGDVFVRREATTIGQLSDRNTKKMGKYELESKQREDNTKQERSEKQKLHKKINSMDDTQKRKWIMEG
jgi:putative FmdB family regulatory protein